jgi:hypothetical protein
MRIAKEELQKVREKNHGFLINYFMIFLGRLMETTQKTLSQLSPSPRRNSIPRLTKYNAGETTSNVQDCRY